MTTELPVEQARKTLGDLVIKAMSGETTTITRYGKPVAQIIPYTEEPTMSTMPGQCPCGIARNNEGDCGDPIGHMYCSECVTCRACARYVPAPRIRDHAISPAEAKRLEEAVKAAEGLSDFELFIHQPDA